MYVRQLSFWGRFSFRMGSVSVPVPGIDSCAISLSYFRAQERITYHVVRESFGEAPAVQGLLPDVRSSLGRRYLLASRRIHVQQERTRVRAKEALAKRRQALGTTLEARSRRTVDERLIGDDLLEAFSDGEVGDGLVAEVACKITTVYSACLMCSKFRIFRGLVAWLARTSQVLATMELA